MRTLNCARLPVLKTLTFFSSVFGTHPHFASLLLGSNMLNTTTELELVHQVWLVADESTYHGNGSNVIEDEYRTAAEVALGCAVFVALAILLTLVWNSVKRNAANRQQSSEMARRPTTTSLERLVEDRLQDCPPPYSADGDKPPSYEDSFEDYDSPFALTTSNTSSDNSSGRFRPSSEQMQQSSVLRNQANVFSYDNEAFDGADGQLSGRSTSSSPAICTISSGLDASQTTQSDQDNHLFSVHL